MEDKTQEKKAFLITTFLFLESKTDQKLLRITVLSLKEKEFQPLDYDLGKEELGDQCNVVFAGLLLDKLEIG